MIVTATQETIEKKLILTPSKNQDFIPGMKAEIQFSIQNLFQFGSYEYLVFERSKLFSDLMIPRVLFPPTLSKTNIFNMLNEDFVIQKNCQLPVGYLVQIANGSPYNQLSSFSKKINHYLQCSLNETQSSITGDSTELVLNSI
jgi:hypothetical protein